MLSLEEEEGYRTFTAQLQHDLNCLSNESKQTRLLALKRLEKNVQVTNKTPAVYLVKLCTEHTEFQTQVVKLFADPVDTCREISLRLVHK
jgi:hypothetical protein